MAVASLTLSSQVRTRVPYVATEAGTSTYLDILHIMYYLLGTSYVSVPQKLHFLLNCADNCSYW